MGTDRGPAAAPRQGRGCILAGNVAHLTSARAWDPLPSPLSGASPREDGAAGVVSRAGPGSGSELGGATSVTPPADLLQAGFSPAGSPQGIRHFRPGFRKDRLLAFGAICHERLKALGGRDCEMEHAARIGRMRGDPTAILPYAVLGAVARHGVDANLPNALCSSGQGGPQPQHQFRGTSVQPPLLDQPRSLQARKRAGLVVPVQPDHRPLLIFHSRHHLGPHVLKQPPRPKAIASVALADKRERSIGVKRRTDSNDQQLIGFRGQPEGAVHESLVRSKASICRGRPGFGARVRVLKAFPHATGGPLGGRCWRDVFPARFHLLEWSLGRFCVSGLAPRCRGGIRDRYRRCVNGRRLREGAQAGQEDSKRDVCRDSQGDIYETAAPRKSSEAPTTAPICRSVASPSPRGALAPVPTSLWWDCLLQGH